MKRILFILISILLLSSCNKTKEPEFVYLSYEVNGGVEIEKQKVPYKSNSYTLVTPYKEGYNFVGWFTSADFNSDSLFASYAPHEYHSSPQINEDTTIYAKWEPKYSTVEIYEDHDTYRIINNVEYGTTLDKLEFLVENKTYIIQSPTNGRTYICSYEEALCFSIKNSIIIEVYSKLAD